MFKPFLLMLGWISFALGIIGAFLPVLPTVPFMILSAFLFSKSSPRLHKWLLSIPQFGPAVEEWETKKVIRPKVKIKAITLVLLSFGMTIIFSSISIKLKIMLSVMGSLVCLFIGTRKSGE